MPSSLLWPQVKSVRGGRPSTWSGLGVQRLSASKPRSPVPLCVCTCVVCASRTACMCVVHACTCVQHVCVHTVRVVCLHVCGVCAYTCARMRTCGVCSCVRCGVPACVVVCLRMCARAHVVCACVCMQCACTHVHVCTCVHACVLCLCTHSEHPCPVAPHTRTYGSQHSPPRSPQAPVRDRPPRARSRRRAGASRPGEVICSRRSAPVAGALGAGGGLPGGSLRSVRKSHQCLRAPPASAPRHRASWPCENQLGGADGSVLNFYVIGKMK